KLKSNLKAKTAVDKSMRQSSAKGKGVAHVSSKRESPDSAGSADFRSAKIFRCEPTLAWPSAEPRYLSGEPIRSLHIKQDKFHNQQSTTTVKRAGLQG